MRFSLLGVSISAPHRYDDTPQGHGGKQLFEVFPYDLSLPIRKK
jgi:hypothetical protein